MEINFEDGVIHVTDGGKLSFERVVEIISSTPPWGYSECDGFIESASDVLFLREKITTSGMVHFKGLEDTKELQVQLDIILNRESAVDKDIENLISSTEFLKACMEDLEYIFNIEPEA